MRAHRIALAIAAVATLVPTVATAKSVEEKDVNSGKTRLDPTSGYILISGSERQTGMFIRVPDAESWREYEADRLKAFAKAQKKYPSQVESWQAKVAYARQA